MEAGESFRDGIACCVGGPLHGQVALRRPESPQTIQARVLPPGACLRFKGRGSEVREQDLRFISVEYVPVEIGAGVFVYAPRDLPRNTVIEWLVRLAFDQRGGCPT